MAPRRRPLPLCLRIQERNSMIMPSYLLSKRSHVPTSPSNSFDIDIQETEQEIENADFDVDAAEPHMSGAYGLHMDGISFEKNSKHQYSDSASRRNQGQRFGNNRFGIISRVLLPILAVGALSNPSLQVQADLSHCVCPQALSASPPTTADRFQASASVFRGTLLSIHDESESDNGYPYVMLYTTQVYKGNQFQINKNHDHSSGNMNSNDSNGDGDENENNEINGDASDEEEGDNNNDIHNTDRKVYTKRGACGVMDWFGDASIGAEFLVYTTFMDDDDDEVNDFSDIPGDDPSFTEEEEGGTRRAQDKSHLEEELKVKVDMDMEPIPQHQGRREWALVCDGTKKVDQDEVAPIESDSDEEAPIESVAENDNGDNINIAAKDDTANSTIADVAPPPSPAATNVDDEEQELIWAALDQDFVSCVRPERLTGAACRDLIHNERPDLVVELISSNNNNQGNSNSPAMEWNLDLGRVRVFVNGDMSVVADKKAADAKATTSLSDIPTKEEASTIVETPAEDTKANDNPASSADTKTTASTTTSQPPPSLLAHIGQILTGGPIGVIEVSDDTDMSEESNDSDHDNDADTDEAEYSSQRGASIDMENAAATVNDESGTKDSSEEVEEHTKEENNQAEESTDTEVTAQIEEVEAEIVDEATLARQTLENALVIHVPFVG